MSKLLKLRCPSCQAQVAVAAPVPLDTRMRCPSCGTSLVFSKRAGGAGQIQEPRPEAAAPASTNFRDHNFRLRAATSTLLGAVIGLVLVLLVVTPSLLSSGGGTADELATANQVAEAAEPKSAPKPAAKKPRGAKRPPTAPSEDPNSSSDGLDANEPEGDPLPPDPMFSVPDDAAAGQVDPGYSDSSGDESEGAIPWDDDLSDGDSIDDDTYDDDSMDDDSYDDDFDGDESDDFDSGLPDETTPDPDTPDPTAFGPGLPNSTTPNPYAPGPSTTPGSSSSNSGTSPGTNPNGTNPNGTNPNGTNPNGTNPNGTNSNGTNPNGTNPNGTNPNGTNPDGTNPNGTNGGGEQPPSGRSNQLKNLPRMPLHRQPDNISCGPTSVQMVLGYYGIAAGIEPLKTTCKTRWLEFKVLGKEQRIGMTTPQNVRIGLEEYGVPATLWQGQSLDDILRFIDEDRPPIILARSGEATWHYMVIVGYVNGTSAIRVYDPGTGAEDLIDGSHLDMGWTFSGDFLGNKIDDMACLICEGDRMVETRCKPCFGTGGTKFAKCPICDGKKRMPLPCRCITGRWPDDFARKCVESYGVFGHTLIVPDSAPDGTVPTPNVTGLALDDAREALAQRSLGFELVGPSASVNSRIEVLEQQPPAGERVPLGTKVQLRVTPIVTVPDVTGLTVAEAQRILKTHKLKSVVDSEFVLRDDLVTAQKLAEAAPAPGQAYAGSTVVLGPIARRVPRLVGLRWSDAINKLRAMRLAADKHLVSSRGVYVLSQLPEAGMMIDPAAPIELTPAVRMPHVLDQTLAKARHTLGGMGLTVHVERAGIASTANPEAHGLMLVSGQSPQIGELVPLDVPVLVQFTQFVYVRPPHPQPPQPWEGPSGFFPPQGDRPPSRPPSPIPPLSG